MNLTSLLTVMLESRENGGRQQRNVDTQPHAHSIKRTGYIQMLPLRRGKGQTPPSALPVLCRRNVR